MEFLLNDETPLHNASQKNITKKEFENLRHAFFLNVETGKETKKRAFVMAGIPGSGKTTFIQNSLNEGTFPAGCFILSPDKVMESIAGYNIDFETHGAEFAFNSWEMPAKQIAYQLLDDAIKLQANIIIDMGAASTEIFEMIEKLKHQHQYEIIMYWINVPVNLALSRVKKRSRYISKNTVLEREQTLQKLKPKYVKMVDQFNDI